MCTLRPPGAVKWFPPCLAPSLLYPLLSSASFVHFFYPRVRAHHLTINTLLRDGVGNSYFDTYRTESRFLSPSSFGRILCQHCQMTKAVFDGTRRCVGRQELKTKCQYYANHVVMWVRSSCKIQHNRPGTQFPCFFSISLKLNTTN